MALGGGGGLAAGAVAGAIGEFAGVHVALWVGGSCLALAFLPVFLSPVRTRTELPQQEAVSPGVGGGSARKAEAV